MSNLLVLNWCLLSDAKKQHMDIIVLNHYLSGWTNTLVDPILSPHSLHNILTSCHRSVSVITSRVLISFIIDCVGVFQCLINFKVIDFRLGFPGSHFIISPAPEAAHPHQRQANTLAFFFLSQCCFWFERPVSRKVVIYVSSWPPTYITSPGVEQLNPIK